MKTNQIKMKHWKTFKFVFFILNFMNDQEIKIMIGMRNIYYKNFKGMFSIWWLWFLTLMVIVNRQ